MATKMPKLPVIHSPYEWDLYQTQLIKYQKEQLARQKAKIAAQGRKIKRLQDLLAAAASAAAQITSAASELDEDEDFSARDRAERASIADED